MKRDPYKDDQLLELVGDLCNFTLDQIVHVRGAYHDRESDLGTNPQYQHLRETERAIVGDNNVYGICIFNDGLYIFL